MASGRFLVPVLVGGLLLGSQLRAQGTTGTITGRVVDSASQQGIANVNVVIMGGQRGTLSRDDGGFTLTGVSAGSYTVRVSRIGYRPQTQPAVVTAGASITVNFTMNRQAAVLSEIVVTGYGTQRREAISGSVSTVDATQADVGVVTNANQMLTARVAGVQLTQNSGEPGAGAQIRIRGGTSISASNDPLYVVDGVPLQNASTSPDAAGVAYNAQLARSPLNSINPSDIESITVLKDAAATAIYGSRGANGVVLITTKRGVTQAAGNMEYDAYVGASSPAKKLGLATGDQYRSYVQSQVASGGLPATAASSLGTASTDWEDAVERTGIATNHNVAFSGGSAQTQYRASLNYFDQEAVIIGNGLKRYQGRLNANHDAMSGKLRIGLNLMASRVNNIYGPIENGGGFTGGLFTNMLIYNPTFPVKTATGSYYEVGTGAQDVRNPVGMAREIQDIAPEDRILGNATATYSLFSNLTSQTTVGIDNNNSTRRVYYPRSSPIGAGAGGIAVQSQLQLNNQNLQQLLTFSPHFGASSELEVVGGYEYTHVDNRGFNAQAQGFITDAFGVDNLGAATASASPLPTSYENESVLVSFFGRANYGFANKYFLTGVLRRDGSSILAPGHQWELFPALSGSWRLSEESFFKGGVFSNLSIRAGWGKQGNQAVQPYQTQLLLRTDNGAAYPFGGVVTTGLRAAQVGNPNLKWETATQTSVGVDYGLWSDRLTGSVEFYNKTTKDLLFTVSVPQPAVVSTRLENIGSLRNRGLEASVDGEMWRSGAKTLSGGVILSVERNEVISLGDTSRKPIQTGFVNGQGQSNQYSELIVAGHPLGTFYAPKFLGVVNGQQTFACLASSAGCVAGVTTNPTDADRIFYGSANPDFTLGLHNNLTWNKFDASWLVRGEFGGKVFNNTALVYQTKSDAKQGRNFLAAALDDPDNISEPAKYSTRWIEDRTFVRLQNITLGYTWNLPARLMSGRTVRTYVSGDNLILLTGYKGYDPEVYSTDGSGGGIAVRGLDYLTYPRARTYTFGAHIQF
ncbi:MAG TPA: SusC/RagA family TonB-linked outer membrane protein [Gemmatimonadaceae bacterium]|nr:SusC/RagA family TonB-linked outer membrane protein [Gemmatimonadaceae bacterium]